MRRLVTALLSAALAACASAPKPEPTPDTAPSTTPAAAAQPATPADPEAFRNQQPEPGKPPDLVLPTFQRAQLDNGLTVMVSTRRELPLVYAGVAFAAGASRDAKNQRGLANLTYLMLLEGAGKRDTVALDNAFGDLGDSPNFVVGLDGAMVGARVLSRNADALAGLLADVAMRPTFNAKAFERRKKQALADLVRSMSNPSFLARQASGPVFYGEDHPYATVPAGSPATVQGLTLADAKGYYQKYVGPRAAAVVFAGDITLDDAVALAKKHFGAWKGSAVPPAAPPAPAAPPRQWVHVVPKPGLDQTVVMMGRPGIAAGHPDEHALDLAMSVFGGFFGSRLNMNLREAHGYTYGATGLQLPLLGVGQLFAYSSVRADVTGPALTEILNELKGLRSKPITSQELEAAREGLIRGVPGSFETVEGLGSSASDLFIKRLPLDEYARTVEGLRKATAAEVQRVAEAYLDPAAMQIILVGDPALIQEQVGPLGLGKLTAEEPDAAPSAAPAKAAP